MDWQRIEANVDFHDPESNFRFCTVNAGVELHFRDWQNRIVRFHFQNVSHFQCSPLCPLPDCRGEGIFTIEDSPLIAKLRECLAIGPSEPATHYILATTSSEVEWCEIIAESHGISIEDADS